MRASVHAYVEEPVVKAGWTVGRKVASAVSSVYSTVKAGASKTLNGLRTVGSTLKNSFKGFGRWFAA